MRIADLIAASLLSCISWPGVAASDAPATSPDCGSLVIIRCEAPVASGSMRREPARRLEERRANPVDVMDRIVIEDDLIRPASPESVISRALGRPYVQPGEHSFPLGEGAQCTCRNVCPPWPLPCCSCTDQVGSRHATAPGWKPTN